MLALLRGMLCLTLVVGTPSWADGFYDGEQHGTYHCRQSRVTYQWNTTGPVIENYSDLGDLALQGETAPLDFNLNFSQLLPYLQSTGAKVVVLELTINRSTMTGATRVLVLSVGLANGAPVLYADWVDARPYWSTANAIPAADLGSPSGAGPVSTVVDSAEFMFAASATYSNIVISPVGVWKGIAVHADQHSDATFMMEIGPSTTQYRPLRLRTGVISSTAELQNGMGVEFQFYLSGPPDS